MARRKKSYGYTPAEHKISARTFTLGARGFATKVREALRAGDCNQAMQDLGALNRAIGKAQSHRSSWKKTSVSPWKVSISLEGKFYRRCVLKRKSYRSPR